MANVMWLPLALTAALLTSFLPIINKRLLVDADVRVVAWGINLLSLPVLAAGSLVLFPLPSVDGIFWLGVVGSALLNMAATLLSTQAWKIADASLITPFLTFNPAFTLLIAWLVLGENPTVPGVLGVGLIVVGSYVINVAEVKRSWWGPFRAIVRQPGVGLAVLASFLWGLTPVTEKVAMQHSVPPNPPIVALGSTALMVVGLTLPLWSRPGVFSQMRRHAGGFGLAAAIAGIAPIFGFTAIGAGLVGYVTAVFKLSALLTVIWAGLLLKEQHQRPRLAGAACMVAGALLMAG